MKESLMGETHALGGTLLKRTLGPRIPFFCCFYVRKWLSFTDAPVMKCCLTTGPDGSTNHGLLENSESMGQINLSSLS